MTEKELGEIEEFTKACGSILVYLGTHGENGRTCEEMLRKLVDEIRKLQAREKTLEEWADGNFRAFGADDGNDMAGAFACMLGKIEELKTRESHDQDRET